MLADGKIPYPIARVTNGGPDRAHWEYLPCDDLVAVGDRKLPCGAGGQLVFEPTGVFLPGSMHPITGQLYERNETGIEDSVWHNKHSVAFFGSQAVRNSQRRSTRSKSQFVDYNKLASALFAIDADDVHAWITVAYGLKGAMGDSGRDVWLAWAQDSPRFNLEENNDRWDRAPASPYGLALVYSTAAKYGWTPSDAKDVEVIA